MSRPLPLLLLLLLLSGCAERPVMPPGYPDRSADLDVLPGFRNPPPGYGEVPFWWWSGDTLNAERLIEQLGELHRKGVSGVQVNYSHLDTPGWLTDQDDPPIFSDAWWQVYSRISEECERLNMGIGLSTYTLDWPRGAENLFYKLIYRHPELNAVEIQPGLRLRVKGGDSVSARLHAEPVSLSANSWAGTTNYTVTPERIALRAYPVHGDTLRPGGMDLSGFIAAGRIEWQAPPGEWEVWEFLALRQPGSLNPLLAGSGDTVVRRFFQPFQDKAPGGSSKGLNYFFNDELHIGLGKYAWNPDFPSEFRRRKGYDLMEVLPAMWRDTGPNTPKVRMDYADVRMALMEERYFAPVYQWHADRGMIFGCDSESRGLDPSEFGDYFRATRWYSAPGHDTPGGTADPMKGRVSASIANLYRRPRVWLEGYHSLGWGATPGQLMYATRENYLYGCTLLNLHGLYASTYGSHWEWAPPCYHFRMPYWAHMDVFLKYFERLSYLMSQGHTVCDVAVLYPVAPSEAGMDGQAARTTAFELGRQLLSSGINFEFIDNESLARAVVENDRLLVPEAGAAYRALVFPNMEAVRWPSIEKAAAFTAGGGFVFAVGALPTASDRAGRGDTLLARLNRTAFIGGRQMKTPEEACAAIARSFVPDVRGRGHTVRALHRKAGFRDVYLVMDAPPGTVVEFRAKGAVELWDPWTGHTTPMVVTGETEMCTMVEMPLEAYEASLVVFTPGKKHRNPPAKTAGPVQRIKLPDAWNVRFIPTMDNTWGDFRLPVTAENKIIGLEARRFAWAREDAVDASVAMLPATADAHWERKLHGFGTQFYVLGPLPANAGLQQLEPELVRLKGIDPMVPVVAGGHEYFWKPYDFSWRWGKEGDPGHQGWHGLKRRVTDDFICLGKPEEALNETRYVGETAGGVYYLWSSATVREAVDAEVLYSRQLPDDGSHSSPVLVPASLYLNGRQVRDPDEGIRLKSGTNHLLLRYEGAGRGHFVLRRREVPQPQARQVLAMRWWGDAGLIPFDATAGQTPAEWFRFVTAPGTAAIRLQALGEVEAWLDGTPMVPAGDGRFEVRQAPKEAAVVALRIRPHEPGLSGGALIPEPVVVETDGSGRMATGDWSGYGILHNYSGGVLYKNSLHLEAPDARAPATLDLGDVAGTAGVTVNGRSAGVRVAPPWKVDLTGLLRSGENSIEVMVYNTLANHYQTIPSRYRGSPASGLLGPVTLTLEK